MELQYNREKTGHKKNKAVVHIPDYGIWMYQRGSPILELNVWCTPAVHELDGGRVI